MMWGIPELVPAFEGIQGIQGIQDIPELPCIPDIQELVPAFEGISDISEGSQPTVVVVQIDRGGYAILPKLSAEHKGWWRDCLDGATSSDPEEFQVTLADSLPDEDEADEADEADEVDAVSFLLMRMLVELYRYILDNIPADKGGIGYVLGGLLLIPFLVYGISVPPLLTAFMGICSPSGDLISIIISAHSCLGEFAHYELEGASGNGIDFMALWNLAWKPWYPTHGVSSMPEQDRQFWHDMYSRSCSTATVTSILADRGAACMTRQILVMLRWFRKLRLEGVEFNTIIGNTMLLPVLAYDITLDPMDMQRLVKLLLHKCDYAASLTDKQVLNMLAQIHYDSLSALTVDGNLGIGVQKARLLWKELWKPLHACS